MIKKWLRGLVVVSTLSLGGVFPVFAQSVSLPNPLTSCNDLTCPVTSVINFLYTIAIPICAIMVLVGGFQMMTAAGDPEKFSKGRKTIIYAAIGFVVVILAGSVAQLIRNTIGG